MRDPVLARDAIVVKFSSVLPGWLRRCGVQRADLDDAVQEALAAALVKLRGCPSDPPLDDMAARRELMRIVSNVALRARRQAQRQGERYVSIGNIEMPTVRDEERWVEARVMILTAIENLDEPARALIYAHEIEGQTYAEIAAILKVKEDAAEKRVVFAKQRLRAEIERLERGRMRTQHVKSSMLVGAGFDSFDRAVFGALHEVLGKKLLLLQPAKMWNVPRPNFPTAVFAGALVLAPNPSMTITDATALEDERAPSVAVASAATQDTDMKVSNSLKYLLPFISMAQGCAVTPSTVERPSTTVHRPPTVVPPPPVEAPVRILGPKEDPPDSYWEEKERRKKRKPFPWETQHTSTLVIHNVY